MKKILMSLLIINSLQLYANAGTDSCTYNLVVNKDFPVDAAIETCKLNKCAYDLVVVKDFSIDSAKATCELDYCGYHLVVVKDYPIDAAKAICSATP